MREVNSEPKEDRFFLDELTDQAVNDPWTVILPILGESTKFKIDCGADVTLLTKATYDALPQKPQLNVTNISLQQQEGKTLKGKTRYKGHHYRDRIYVTECANNLLSRNMCTSMGILTLNIDECNDFTDNDIFGDIETIKGEPVKIELKDDVTPYHISSARRVAIPLMDKVEAEIKRMERQNIIADLCTRRISP